MSNLLLWALLLPSATPPPADGPLTIGSPAPKLGSLTFLRGELPRELPAKTIRVVEFSGTACAPCLRCIPLLNELRRKHPGVVLVSIYSEDAKTVRAFLAEKGGDISFAVAADTSLAARRAWSVAAYRVGIPHAFIVGRDGKIAWIGDPADMDRPLAEIVAGTFDPSEDAMRLKVEQEATRRQQRAEEREERGTREYERIDGLIRAGNLAAALADTDRALAQYQGCPQTTALLRDTRVYVLANLPGKREEAFRAAAERAVEAKVDGQSTRLSDTAQTLLNAVEHQPPAGRDRRMIDLALALLRDPEPTDLQGKPGNALPEYQIDRLRFTGLAYHLRGDSPRATAAVREALAKARALKAAVGEDQEKFARTNRRLLDALEMALKEYAGAVQSRPAAHP
jgi:hypothetical protein